MKRSHFGGSFLVVEGITDCRLYGKFIDKDACNIIVAHSKDNVRISVRESYLRRNDRKVLGIVDRDLDKLKGTAHARPIFATDGRDTDTEMIRGPALDSVLLEYGDPDKLETFTDKYGEVRDAVAAACYPLGLLMYVSDMHDHDLSFKDPDHSLFVDRRGLRVNVDNMIDTVISNSPHSSAGRRDVSLQLSRELKEERDPWDVCRGHDMLSVIAFGLREIFGSYNARYIKAGEVGGALRLAYDKATFRSTSLYRETSDWSLENRFRVWSP
ncbi:MAG: DUF4435 domain-containing protein [Methanomassiliicoccaceae archaeon]|jgi:hypothetical protein|nr:DUF4435 domain-containing protein [Methanomassiliicoccaceae archaeon]